MATYNGEKYLQEQLDSFLMQTRLPDELVVSDDASTDSTVEIIEAFKSKAPFEVKVIRNKENEGHTRNFEKAIKKTTGNLVFLSDQDDIWKENKIENQIYHLKENDLVLCDMYLMDDKMSFSGKTLLQNYKMNGYSENSYAHGCAMAFNKKLKEVILPIPSEKYFNYDIWINSLASYIGKRKIIKGPLQYYRRHEKAITNESLTSNLNKFKYFKNYFVDGLRNNSDAYKQQYIRNNIISDRLTNKNVLSKTDYLDNYNKYLALRYLAYNRNLFKRISIVIYMLRKNAYKKYFNHYISAIKDIIMFMS